MSKKAGWQRMVNLGKLCYVIAASLSSIGSSQQGSSFKSACELPAMSWVVHCSRLTSGPSSHPICCQDHLGDKTRLFL